MPIIPLRNIGMEGVIKDKQPVNVPPNGLTIANSARIEDEAIASSRPSEQILLFTNTPKFVDTFWIQGNDDLIISVEQDGVGGVGGNVTIIGTQIDGVTTIDLTPVVALTPSEYWYGAQYGTLFVITNGIDVPHVLFDTDPGVTPFEPMVGWPTDYRCDVIEGFKGFLFVVGVRIAGVAFPNMVKWSHPISPGDTQFFWDFTNPQLLAGEAIISTRGRSTVGLQRISDTLMIYFDQSVWRCDLVGGQFVMDFQQAWRDDGAITAFAFVEVNGKAVVVGQRDIYIHDGIDKQSISDKVLTKWFYDNIKLDFPVRVSYYPRRNEIFIIMRTIVSGEANLVLTWNEVYNAWTEFDTIQQGGEGILADLFLGPKLDAVITTYGDLFIDDTRYNELSNKTYNDFEEVNEEHVFYAWSQTTKQLLDIDTPALTTPDPAVFVATTILEHSRMDFDELLGDAGEKIKYLNRVYPQMRGFGTVRWTFGSADTPNSGIRWESPIDFDIENDVAVDIRVSGRYLAYRLEADTRDARFQLAGMDWDIDVTGVQ